MILWSDVIRQRVNDFAAIPKNNVIKNIFTALYNTARPAVMSDGLLRCVGVCPAALDFLENLIKLLKNGLGQKISHFRIVFLKRNQQITYLITNQSKNGLYREFRL